ncbi:GNAT family N-acetyltransferase [Actinoplanes aureus]|uniref:GNAT family N-acetyltransferase n=1 Tax=Actinoplanes aureus TaxID=2792083 RepID=A0A931C9N5_9ACTN|nr:GNAT family N-acetyltransferase [Actinoplanes aureus]MBG0563927.1 GNAT family N-acetyltransferase [Actinoplanes aureus]
MGITIATTTGELDALAARWDAFAVSSPHASRPLFSLVLHTLGDRGRPHVLFIEEAGRDPILVVARVERRPFRVKAGYRTLLSARARWLVVVAGGVVGAESAEDHRRVLRALSACLRRGDADILQLSKVPLDSPLHRAAAQASRSAPQKHHLSDLSEGFDALVARKSKRTRLRVRKRLQRLGDAGAKLAVRRVGADDEEADVVRILDAITSHSYQRGIGVGFADDDLHRAFIRWAIAGDPYRIWLLSIDGTPVAHLSGLLHARTFHLFDTAFDGAHAEDEPGSILLTRVLQELADDPQVDAFDYGYGDALYKQQMSDESWDETDLLFFAARPRALTLKLLNAGAAAMAALGKRVLGGERVAALRRRERAQAANPAGRA